jgi:hypothetical protein
VVSGNGKSTAAAVLGVLAAAAAFSPWTFYLATILGVLALLLGIAGLLKYDRGHTQEGLFFGLIGVGVGTLIVVVAIIYALDSGTLTNPF